MAGTHSVKETKEAILALVLVGLFVSERLKDGVDMNDATALATKLMMDPEFKAVALAGLDGLEKVPAEIGELDMADMLELAKMIPQVLELLTAKKAA